MIVENFLELVDIDDIILSEEYDNMVDISVDIDQSFLLSNGLISHNSASSSFRKYRDPQTMGAFSLKGKFINVSEISTQKLILNEEAVNLMAALGLKFGQEVDVRQLRYGRILILSDADVDGNSISALLMNFFNKYWPSLFDKKMIYKVETPIVVSINKKNKNKLFFYSQQEYNEWVSNINVSQWEIKYKKGLAALLDDEYDQIINNPKLTLINKDDISDEYLDIWFGKNTELRKNELLKN